jgi:hypothetical protein
LQKDIVELRLALPAGVESNYPHLVILTQYTSYCPGHLGRFIGIRNAIDSRPELGLPLLRRQIAIEQLAIFALAFRIPPDEQNKQNHNNEHQASRSCDDLGIFQ